MIFVVMVKGVNKKMILTEVHQDLFTVPKDYILVHCVSADFALGAGIAKEFAKRGVKEALQTDTFYSALIDTVGLCLVTFATDWEAEYNLVTKEKYWHKPNYKTLRTSLESAKTCCLIPFQSKSIKLAMPRIGCGLDKLQWGKVKQVIEEVFADTDIEILVCSI